MNLNFRGYTPPGTALYFRYYYGVGSLAETAEKSARYKAYCLAEELHFTEASSPTLPLYLTNLNGQQVLTPEQNGVPLLYVYTRPVKHSFPLYLIRSRQDGRYQVTCDPYKLMDRVPIDRDYQTPKRLGFRPYDGTTDIVKLLGYVMPQSQADPTLPYRRLDSVLTDRTYYPGNGLYDADICVRTAPNSEG